ncbi:MAG: flagellar biosynthetic protein FliO [Rhodothermaceae bacterium]|nr:flagellar biosynthetic protein FliO [Rhodothermaceae bacterium]
MFRLPSFLARARRPLSPWRRAVLFGAGLLALWLALQFAPLEAPAPPPVRPAVASERLPVQPGVSSVIPEERLAAVPTRPSRSLLRPGNVIAVLLLVGGGGGALYLRRRRPDDAEDEAALPMASLGALPLDPGLTLRLVRVGEEVLLLGLAQGGITLLRRYAPGEAPADLGTHAGDGAATPPFAALLHQIQPPKRRG